MVIIIRVFVFIRSIQLAFKIIDGASLTVKLC